MDTENEQLIVEIEFFLKNAKSEVKCSVRTEQLINSFIILERISIGHDLELDIKNELSLFENWYSQVKIEHPNLAPDITLETIANITEENYKYYMRRVKIGNSNPELQKLDKNNLKYWETRARIARLAAIKKPHLND